jgi:D-serine deaminase-like pyridoxal phosphate-dependent protein
VLIRSGNTIKQGYRPVIKSPEEKYALYKKALESTRLPALILDLDILNRNIEEIKTRAKGMNIRIASKSVRSLEILKMVLSSSDQFQGILCFSAEEAIYLSDNELDDLLIAYPTNQTSIIEKVIQKTAIKKNIKLMVDSISHVEKINEIAKKAQVVQPICLEIDMSMNLPGLNFGVYRSPIKSIEEVIKIGKKIKELENVKLVGVMGYEAQIAGLGDRNPAQGLKNPIIRFLKRISIPKIENFRVSTINKIKELGIDLEFVNGGGTGSFESTIKDPSVTEVAMGSGLFSPTLFDYYNNFHYGPALFYGLEIARIPAKGMVTCNGGGYIASGTIGIDKVPTPYLPGGLHLTENEGVGEVQTPLINKGQKLNLGDPVFFRHSKAAEVCERFNEIRVYSKGEISNKVLTYRGDGQCFF